MEKQLRILIVDHDALTRRLLTDTLTREGVREVAVARNGPEGLARLQAGSPIDLVVTDPASPSPSGWNLLKDLRAQAPAIPILVLSTVQTEASLARALELGADDYLLKPVDLGDFRKAIARLIHLRSLTPGSAEIDAISRLVVRTKGQGMSVEVTAPTGSSHLHRFECFVQRLLALVLSHEEVLKLKLALEETITNASEWGNRGDQRKIVKLAYSFLPDRVIFRVEDQGEGFNPQEVPNPTSDPIAHVKQRFAAGKRVGGWGLLMVRNAVDEVSFSKRGNVVLMTKFIKPRPRSAGPKRAGEKA